MKRQRCGLGTVLCGGCGVLAALFVACAGGDTPPADQEFRDALRDAYPEDDEVGAAGAGMSGRGGSAMVMGSGGRGGGASQGGGGVNAGGASGSGSTSMGGGAPVAGGPPCDAVETVFLASCATSVACHAEGAFYGDFAVSEESALEYLNVVSPRGAACGLWINSANPERSMIYTKLTGASAECGQRMPLQGDFLTEEQSACVLSWLQQFAD